MASATVATHRTTDCGPHNKIASMGTRAPKLASRSDNISMAGSCAEPHRTGFGTGGGLLAGSTIVAGGVVGAGELALAGDLVLGCNTV